MSHKWVWGVHLVTYPYIVYVYFFTDDVANDPSQARKMWIPLDIILTIGISLYQVFYHFMSKMDHEHHCSDHELDPEEVESKNDSDVFKKLKGSNENDDDKKEHHHHSHNHDH